MNLVFVSYSHEVDIIDYPLPYVQNLPVRNTSTIDLIIIHFTEECDLQKAMEVMSMARYDDGTGNSGHFIIDRNGTIYRNVPVERIANQVMCCNYR